MNETGHVFRIAQSRKRYFDIVESGESVRIMRNGKPIADIVPLPQELPSWKHKLAQPLVIEGCSIGKLILEERENKG